MGKELEKVRRWRERMKAEGKQAVTLWLNRGAVERLNTLAHEAKITASEFIERAVTDTRAKVTDTVTVTQSKVTDTVAVIREIVREEMERALYQAAKFGVTVTQSKVTDTVTDTKVDVTDTVTDTIRKAAALTAERLANAAMALHQQGLSYEQIARQWDTEGIPTLKGGRWHKGTVYNLVQRHQRR